MSFDISPIGATGAAQSTDPTVASSAAQPAAQASPAADDDAAVSVELNTIPSVPPAEVHRAISVAAGSYERLQAQGRQLRFGLEAGSGALSVQLQDLSGNTVSTISAIEALRIAGGGNPN